MRRLRRNALRLELELRRAFLKLWARVVHVFLFRGLEVVVFLRELLRAFRRALRLNRARVRLKPERWQVAWLPHRLVVRLRLLFDEALEFPVLWCPYSGRLFLRDLFV